MIFSSVLSYVFERTGGVQSCSLFCIYLPFRILTPSVLLSGILYLSFSALRLTVGLQEEHLACEQEKVSTSSADMMCGRPSSYRASQALTVN